MLIVVEDATSTSRRPAVQPWLVQDRDFAQRRALCYPVSLSARHLHSHWAQLFRVQFIK